MKRAELFPLIFGLIVAAIFYLFWFLLLLIIGFLIYMWAYGFIEDKYVPFIIHREQKRAETGYYDDCIKKAVPIKTGGEVAHCKTLNLRYGLTLDIIYDTTGEILRVEHNYSMNGIHYEAQTRSVEWHASADKLNPIFMDLNYQMNPVHLSNDFYYIFSGPGILVH